MALGQALVLVLWRRHPLWLAVGAGLRLSDLFTDLSYVMAAPHLSPAAWWLLLPPAPLTAFGVAVLLCSAERLIPTRRGQG